MDDPRNNPDATRWMNAAAEGDTEAADQLFPLVFEQLRNAARSQLARERPGHTLSATALVHEAYLKLAGPREVPWSSRRHYFIAAAQAMQRILVDHARARAADKRGGPEARQAALNLRELPDPACPREAAGFLILHDALSRLEQIDSSVAEVVRLRYFAGLSVEETATALGVSTATVKRTWAYARGWLKEAIESERC